MSRVTAKMNLVDRVVNYFNPVAGNRRLVSRVMHDRASAFLGARRDRRATSEWTPAIAASADAETLPDLDILRSRSRDLVRNDPLAQSAVSTKVVNVIGAGHVVLPEINATRLGLSPEKKEEWERAAGEIWNDWASSPDCDITRHQTFGELEDLVYRSRLQSGDVLVIRRFKRRRGRLLASAVQVVEADRLSNSDWQMDSATLAGGVEMDADGAPTFYHIADRHAIDRAVEGVTWKRVPAFSASGRRNVLHIHGPRWRPDMTRYAPMMAPVIESLKQRSRYTEAELMAAVVSACFAIGMESPDGALGGALEGAKKLTDDGDKASKSIKLSEPGLIFDLLPDEKIQSVAPGRPNPEFEPFIRAIAQEVGAGTDLPHELLVKQFQASYSASRAALEMAWQFFRVDRAHHILQFCRPVYEDVIGEAVARGLLTAPGFFKDPLQRAAWLGSIWIGPVRPTIDPVKEATADKLYYELGVNTRSRMAAERYGADYRQIVARRKREDDMTGGSADAAADDPIEDLDDDDGPDSDLEDK